ncbi:MAG: glycosyl transferase [Nitrospirae bacterium CG2_30_53_67]|nr:MAG: glycosyl transferase [Nitrospirae bacterium CG2_30_53_67]
MDPRIAVLIPCFNEEAAIEKVVGDFREVLPQAEIYVYDNNSTDHTAEAARKAGAFVRHESHQGKGYVVRRMFREVDADIYVMVDGDGTYPADGVHSLIRPVSSGKADMCVGSRIADKNSEAFRTFHVAGNHLVKNVVNRLFGSDLSDILSGYRCFNHHFVTSIPLLSRGFEVEVEMTIQALDKGLVIQEIELPYRERPSGSSSKLRTFRDGFLVLLTIFNIFKDYKPLAFFFAVSILLLLLSLVLGWNAFHEFSADGWVIHPAASVAAACLAVFSVVSLVTGILLDTINRRYKELYVLMTRRSPDYKDHLQKSG